MKDKGKLKEALFYNIISFKSDLYQSLSSIGDLSRSTRVIKIRDGTEYEEMIGVKREWIYPLHKSDGSAYYDVAIMELGNLKKESKYESL